MDDNLLNTLQALHFRYVCNNKRNYFVVLLLIFTINTVNVIVNFHH